MINNLPPGCNSADGGIDHAYEVAIEKIMDMAFEADLDAGELICAMKVGIKAVELTRPIIAEKINSDRSYIYSKI